MGGDVFVGKVFRLRAAGLAAAVVAFSVPALSCSPIPGDHAIPVPTVMVFEPAASSRTRAVALQPASLNSGARLATVPDVLWPSPGEGYSLPDPIATSPRYVLAWPTYHWRDPRFEVFRWYRFPSILILDFADNAVQDRMLKRIAFFVEKAGFRGRLAHDAEIADLHGWNAHDYRASDLADFFAAARAENFPLNREELELERLLLDSGLMWEVQGGALEGEGGFISISREATRTLRFLFMAHEGFHGLFHTDAEFRAFTEDRWNRFDEGAKRMFLAFLRDQDYDVSEDYIVQKEFASFLLQQSTSQAKFYFGRRIPSRIFDPAWHDENRNLETASGDFPRFASIFTAEAEAFSAFVGGRWGFAAGRVW